MNAIAHIVATLRRANARLLEAAERDRGELERRVSERTAALERMNRRVQRELEIAQRIQRNLLPERRREFPGVTASAEYLPCEELGGDIVGAFQVDETRIALYGGDVSGHGIYAAMVMSYVKKLVESSVKRILLKGQYVVKPPGAVLTSINQAFMAEISLGDPEIYLTLFLGILDLRNLELAYASAGIHRVPLVLSGGRLEELFTQSDFPIGHVESHEYETHRRQLGPGDSFLFVSDGVVEADHDGEAYGIARLKAEVLRLAGAAGRPGPARARRLGLGVPPRPAAPGRHVLPPARHPVVPVPGAVGAGGAHRGRRPVVLPRRPGPPPGPFPRARLPAGPRGARHRRRVPARRRARPPAGGAGGHLLGPRRTGGALRRAGGRTPCCRGAGHRGARAPRASPGWDLLVEVTARPGVTDPVALTAREALGHSLGAPLPDDAVVQTAVQYLIAGPAGAGAPGAQLAGSARRRTPRAVLPQPAGPGRRDHHPRGVGRGAASGRALSAPGAGEPAGRRDLRPGRHGRCPARRSLSRGRLLALSLDEMKAVRTWAAGRGGR